MTSSSDRQPSFEALSDIVARLRAPGGCPWDREQTHASLRPNLLEESYEALDALDQGSPSATMEELGDLLVQIVFHCQIASDLGEFTNEQFFRQVQDKLVRRHPHVFGDALAPTTRDVEEQWQAIKQAERGAASVLDGVPPSTPALARAQSISNRAARSGFEWDDLDGVMAKLAEELTELEQAGNHQEREHELGDVLFTLVNIARWRGIDAETALRAANQRFYRRFTHMEAACRQQGVTLADLSMEAREALWQEAKRRTAPDQSPAG